MSTEGNPNTTSSLGKIMVLLLAGGVLALIALSIGKHRGPDPTLHPAVGRTFRTFRVLPLVGGGEPVDGVASLGGKVSVIDFWATWCPPCREEFPSYLALAAKYGNRPDFRLYSVEHDASTPGADLTASQENIKPFLKARGATIPIYYDPDHMSYGGLAVLGGTQGGILPTTLVVDRAGIVRAVWEGSSSIKMQELDEIVSRVLAEQEPVPGEKEEAAAARP